jgi:hypothetical protein
MFIAIDAALRSGVTDLPELPPRLRQSKRLSARLTIVDPATKL